jgi:putative flippase GtrA
VLPLNCARAGVAGEAIRFLLVGGVATGVDVALFNVLHVLAGAEPLAAKSVSTVTAAVVAFVGNRQWSFASGHGHELRVQVARYVAVTAAGLGLALAPIAVDRYVLGLEGAVAMNVAANVVGLGLATVFRFYGYRRWVFAPQDRAPTPTAGGTRGTSR